MIYIKRGKMKTKDIDIDVYFGDKTFYFLLILSGLVVFAGIAIAVENWEIMGHSPTEIGIGIRSVQERLCAVEAALNMADSSCSAIPGQCTTNTECFNADSSKPYCVNGVCVQCLSNADCTAPQTCNLTTHTCQGGGGGSKSWVLIGGVTGLYNTGSANSVFNLPSECLNGNTCRMKYVINTSRTSINGEWQKNFTQMSSSWTSPAEGTQSDSSGTNGDSTKTNIFDKHEYYDPTNGDTIYKYYFRDDCDTDTSSTKVCLTIVETIFLPSRQHLYVYVWK